LSGDFFRPAENAPGRDDDCGDDKRREAANQADGRQALIKY
jgi:hypothetical protein